MTGWSHSCLFSGGLSDNSLAEEINKGCSALTAIVRFNRVQRIFVIMLLLVLPL